MAPIYGWGSTASRPELLRARALTYNLRSQTDFMTDCVNTRRYGLNSTSYFPPKVRDMIPLEIKNVNSFKNLKLRLENGLRKTVLAIFVGHTYRI